MSAKPIDNASKKIALKRKRAPVWPLATRVSLEQAVSALAEQGHIREFSPPDVWRIHPSTEARGSGFQHERRVWGSDDHEVWVTLKIRQHAQDPTKSAGRSGFEGSNVSGLNTHLAWLLRSFARNGGPRIAVEATGSSSRAALVDHSSPHRSGSAFVSGATQDAEHLGYDAAAPEVDESGFNTPGSADREEEEAAADAAAAARSGPLPGSDGVDRSFVVPLPDSAGPPMLNLPPCPSGHVSSYLDYQSNPCIWIEDPDRSPSPPPGGDDDSPSHISNSVTSTGSGTPTSVPSTVPQVDSGRTPDNWSVESGRPTRCPTDGRWRYPDGSLHPLNIYDGSDYDSDDDNFESSAKTRQRLA